MIANFPWYDLAELKGAFDSFWTGLARHLRRAGVGGVPGRLDRTADPRAQWRDPRLLLSQACGYDVVRSRDAARLRVVGTPRFDVPHCPAGSYRSWIVVRDDHPASRVTDLRGQRCAINEPTSYSGHHALRAMIGPLRQNEASFFRRVVASGSHVNSLTLLAAGADDVAAIDCMTWALLAEHRPAAVERARIIDLTPPVPAPPYVTSAHTSDDTIDRLRDALDAAFDDPLLLHARSDLRVAGLERMSRCRYLALAS